MATREEPRRIYLQSASCRRGEICRTGELNVVLLLNLLNFFGLELFGFIFALLA